MILNQGDQKTFEKFDCPASLASHDQGCESVFISSGSGSSILGWTPIQIRIRVRIQSGSRALMTKNRKKITSESFFFNPKNAIYISLGLHILLDPDPNPQIRLNPDPIRIRIRIRNPGHGCLHRLLQRIWDNGCKHQWRAGPYRLPCRTVPPIGYRQPCRTIPPALPDRTAHWVPPALPDRTACPAGPFTCARIIRNLED